MPIQTFFGGYDRNFTYILFSQEKCCIIDPAVPAQEVLAWIREKKLLPQFVIFLHSHFDHIVDLDTYRHEGIPIWGHSSTEIKVDRKVTEGENIGFDSIKIEVLHTPGHRYDCICLLVDGKYLFTSDTLFVENIGRIDLPGSDPKKMEETLQRLCQLPEDIIVYPGHDYGSTPTSTIGREKRNIT